MRRRIEYIIGVTTLTVEAKAAIAIFKRKKNYILLY